MPALDSTLRQRLGQSALEMRAHLGRGIIPFRESRAADHEHGGYLTRFDPEGNSLGTQEKYLNTQCRLLWWFSTLARRHPTTSRLRAMVLTLSARISGMPGTVAGIGRYGMTGRRWTRARSCTGRALHSMPWSNTRSRVATPGRDNWRCRPLSSSNSIVPGWVKTDMGGADAEVGLEEATDTLSTTIDHLSPAQNGEWLDRFGQRSGYAW